MSGKLLFIHCSIVLALAASVSAAEPRSRRFGQEWVRRHRLTIMGLTQRAEAAKDDKYSRAGFAAMLAWKQWDGLLESAVRQGIAWQLYVPEDIPFDDELKSRIKRVHDTCPGGEGFLVWDEPERPELKEVAARVEWLKRMYPEMLVYSKAYVMVWGGNGALLDRDSAAKQYGGKWLDSGIYDEPPVPYSYDEYLNDFVTIIKPDVLCVDPYPFIRPPEGDSEQYLARNYFKNLSAIRKAALKADVPYWSFVQAYEHTGGGGRRYPSESDLRMQVYSTLAYGFTGILYYTYDHVSDRGLLQGVPGTPTYLYDAAQKLNSEAANLGQALRFLSSTDVRYVPGSHLDGGQLKRNPIPDGLGIFHPASRVAEDVREIAIGEQGAQNNGLIGFFRDDRGRRYFMLVNLAHGEGLTADQVKLSFTLTLRPSVGSLVRLSRLTGKPEPVEMKEDRVVLTLPGGTGELFRIGDGAFPGR